MNNRCTGEVGRARKKLKETPENSGYKTPSDGLHACCAFVTHNEKKLGFELAGRNIAPLNFNSERVTQTCLRAP